MGKREEKREGWTNVKLLPYTRLYFYEFQKC